MVDKFGVDAVRYYLLHEIPFANDGNITYELVLDRINGDLANVLGNLVQRTISMGNKYFDGKITNKGVNETIDSDFINLINSLNDKLIEKMDAYQISDAITEIFNVLRASNKYIDDTTPWVLAKNDSDRDRLETVLYNLLESIRVCAIMLKPYLPDTSDKIIKQLNNEVEDFEYTSSNIYNLGEAEVLFQRIDKDKFLKEM